MGRPVAIAAAVTSGMPPSSGPARRSIPGPSASITALNFWPSAASTSGWVSNKYLSR